MWIYIFILFFLSTGLSYIKHKHLNKILPLISVHADNFGKYNDAYYCHFIPAVGLFYDESSLHYVPANIRFDEYNIKGVPASYIHRYTIHDLANIYTGRVSRYNKALNVALPPGANVVIGFWGYNYAGHNINIKKVFIPLSIKQQGQVIGDLTRLVDFQFQYMSVIYRNLGLTLNRTGKFLKIVPGNQLYKNYMTRGGQVLIKAEIKQPIEVIHSETECDLDKAGKQVALIQLVIKNKGVYNEMLGINGQNYILGPHVIRTVTFRRGVTPGILTYIPDNIAIVVQKSRKECAALSDSNVFINNPLYKQVFVSRDDISYNNLFTGIQPGLTNNRNGSSTTFCVTRIPYVLKVNSNACNFPRAVGIRVKQDQCLLMGYRSKEHIILKNKGILLKNLVVEIKAHGLTVDKFSQFSSNIDVISKKSNYLKLRIRELKALKTIDIPVLLIKMDKLQPALDIKITSQDSVIRYITFKAFRVCNVKMDMGINSSVGCLNNKSVYLDINGNYHVDYSDYGDVKLSDVDLSWRLVCNQAAFDGDFDSLKINLVACHNNACSQISVPQPLVAYKDGFIRIKGSLLTPRINKSLVTNLRGSIRLRKSFSSVPPVKRLTCNLEFDSLGYSSVDSFSAAVPQCSSAGGGQILDITPTRLRQDNLLTKFMQIESGKNSFLFDNSVHNFIRKPLLRRLSNDSGNFALVSGNRHVDKLLWHLKLTRALANKLNLRLVRNWGIRIGNVLRLFGSIVFLVFMALVVLLGS